MLFSVIIPAYNRENYIRDCVLSVLEQTYKDFEIILVDDGSSDKTVEICNIISKTDNRLRVIEVNHQGVSNARNTAIEESAGDYLVFLDSDDMIHPILLESVANVINSYNVPMIMIKHCAIKNSQWEDKIVPYIVSQTDMGEVEHMNNAKVIERFFAEKICNIMGGFIVDRKYLGLTRFRDTLHIGEDIYFMYENIVKGGDAAILKNVGYYYRVHNENSRNDLSFSGYMSRYCCNMLQWRNEEQEGRVHNSNIKKNHFFNIYIQIQLRMPMFSDVCKLARKHIKTVKKELWPAFDSNKRKQYYMFTYFSWLFIPGAKRKKKKEMKKRLHNKTGDDSLS